MSTRTIQYRGGEPTSYQLLPSDNKFVIKAKRGYTPEDILKQTTLLKPYQSQIITQSIFPDSNIGVFTCISKEITRDEVKEIIRKYQSQHIEYIGSVFQYQDNGLYQIYTGNIYIEFSTAMPHSECDQIINKFGLQNKRTLHFHTHSYFCQPKGTVDRGIFDLCNDILADARIVSCHPELVTELRPQKNSNLPENTNLHLPDDWWLDMVNAKNAWKLSKGSGIKIAVIDDGIEFNHPAFKNKIIHARDMKSGSSNPFHRPREVHGTPCASIATSISKEAPGIAPLAQIIPIRVTGLGSVLQSEAFYWAIEHGADVISCSWGPPDGDIFNPDDDNVWYPLPDHTRKAFEYVKNNGRNQLGTPIVFAAGNGNEPMSNDGYASAKEVIAVTSVNYKGEKCLYGDYNTPVTCAFPSGDSRQDSSGIFIDHTGIKVADILGQQGLSPGDYYKLFTGTSASCPGVAGVIALMLSANKNLRESEVRSIIELSCDKVGGTYDESGYNTKLGYGVLNAYRAVQNAIKYKSNNHQVKSKYMSNTSTSKKIAIHVAVDELKDSVYKGTYQNLAGCKNDLIMFKELTEGVYTVYEFVDSNATRANILNKIKEVFSAAESGDTIMFTYSGHGGTVSDDDFDEADGLDETLVLHDGLLFDDEIKEFHQSLKKGVRLFWYTDSCHSGSNTRSAVSRKTQRSLQPNLNSTSSKVYRLLDTDLLNQVYQDNKSEYAGVGKQKRAKINKEDYNASIIHFAACQDHQYAAEVNGLGAFTAKVFEKFNENNKYSYQDIFNKVKAEMPINQTPELNLFGDSDDFLNESFFGEKKSIKEEDLPGDSIEEKNITSDLKSCEDLIINSNKEQSFKTKTGSRGKTGKQIRSKGEIATTYFEGETAWDKAYNAYIQNSSNGDTPFIEPDTASAINADQLEETKRGAEEYLETYPSPGDKDNKDRDDFWHLDGDRSQLTAALKKACPKEFLSGKNILDLEEYPLIVHIDTGVIRSGPMRPMNWNYNDSKRFDSPYDRDRFLIPNSIEQQGHGNATLALLAGGKIVFPENSELDSNKYFGGFPFARVVSLKISESVAIIRGQSFARALNYAVDDLKANVVTMSMAGAPSKVMLDAVNHAYDKGVIVVTAAGNTWSKKAKKILPKTVMYPARFNRVIAATGATLDQTPYQNDFNPQKRAKDGKYMQSCHGPAEAMRTAIAAYTPNVLWFDSKNSPKYSKKGGGTSSATPQIAAAAALYYFHHRAVLEPLRSWKKVEIVRAALFETANKDKHGKFGPVHEINGGSFDEYFGNGLLRASDALEVNAQDTLDKINANEEAYREAPDYLGRTGLDDLLKMWQQTIRGKGEDDHLKGMVALEIEQIIHLDPALMEYTGTSELTEELMEKLYKSEYCSNTLKSILSKSIGKSSDRERTREAGLVFVTKDLKLFDENKLEISVLNIEGEINDFPQGKYDDFHLGGFEILVEESTRSGSASISIANEENNKNLAYLISEKDDQGRDVHRWVNTEDKQTIGSRGDSDTNIYVDEDQVLHINLKLNRGLVKGIKKTLVNVYRTFKDEATSNHQGLIYGELINGEFQWNEIKKATKDIRKEIAAQNKTIFFSHGTFSSVENSFEHLLKKTAFKKAIDSKGYGKYLLGFNMSTIKSGIEKNAKDIQKALKDYKIDSNSLLVIGSSRGCLVARYAFREGQKMILSAGPHFGTPMADRNEIGNFINRITGLVISVGGLSSPVMGSITFALKLLANRIWECEGLKDMAPGSDIIEQLNNNNATKLNDNQLLIGMNYTAKRLKAIPDSLIDNQIFKGESNDLIVPFNGAVGNFRDGLIEFSDANLVDVHHLNYYDNEAVIKEVVNWI